MKFGICTSVDQSQPAKNAGWDYIEESTQKLFSGLLPDAEWTGMELVRSSALPIPATNVMVPGQLKITGPEADLSKLQPYMANVLKRAGQAGTKTIVFGSGGARQIPDGTSREQARRQLTEFMSMSAKIAGEYGVTLVIEPLNRKECNVLNSVGESMEYVHAINHPNLKCLVDSYHFWLEDEPLENLRKAMPWIAHVHVADKDGRLAPGESGTADYKPFFKVLKQGGYDGRCSVEGKWPQDIATIGPKVLAHLKSEWNAA